MKVALIGLPQSGKTTLFTAVTGHAPSPAQIGQEQLAAVKVPDPRLRVLADMHKLDRTVAAALEFVDFPGVSLTEPHGQAEFRRHAANMRTCDALVAVLRAFESDAAPPYRDRIDPAADLEELRTELDSGGGGDAAPMATPIEEDATSEGSGEVACPNCGNALMKESAFCNKCGTRIG